MTWGTPPDVAYERGLRVGRAETSGEIAQWRVRAELAEARVRELEAEVARLNTLNNQLVLERATERLTDDDLRVLEQESDGGSEEELEER